MTCAVEGCNRSKAVRLKIETENKVLSVPICVECSTALENSEKMNMELC